MTQCSSHDMFEKFLENGMKHLSEKLQELTEALTTQSKANGEAIAKVLEGQSDRRELCGKRGAELAELQHSDEAQWERLDDHSAKLDKLFEHLWKFAGGLAVFQVIVGVVVAVLVKWVFSGQ